MEDLSFLPCGSCCKCNSGKNNHRYSQHGHAVGGLGHMGHAIQQELAGGTVHHAFCGLEQGNFFIDNEYVFKNAVKKGFDGWVMIEQDTHKRDPRLDLKENMDVLLKWKAEALQ